VSAPEPAPRGERGRSLARSRLEIALFRAAAGALRLLPLRLAAAAGSLLVRIFARLSPSRRRILRENLEAAFPSTGPAEIARIARESAGFLGAGFVDFLEVSEMPEAEVRDRIRFAGEENLRDALGRGRGVLIFSAHFGGWELGALRASFIGTPASLVVRPLDNPFLEAELARRRTRFGNRLISKRDAARDILGALHRGEIVIILVDQNVLASEAVFVPFFGRLAATTPALARFQQKTGAPVLPVFVWPEGRGRYRAEFEKPISAEDPGPPGAARDEAVRRATARYMEVTEAAIRKAPEAWLWMHNRWRTRPGDISDLRLEISDLDRDV